MPRFARPQIRRRDGFNDHLQLVGEDILEFPKFRFDLTDRHGMLGIAVCQPQGNIPIFIHYRYDVSEHRFVSHLKRLMDLRRDIARALLKKREDGPEAENDGAVACRELIGGFRYESEPVKCFFQKFFLQRPELGRTGGFAVGLAFLPKRSLWTACELRKSKSALQSDSR